MRVRLNTIISSNRFQLNQDDITDALLDDPALNGTAPAPDDNIVNVTYEVGYERPDISMHPDSNLFNPTSNLQCVYDYWFSEDFANNTFCPDYIPIMQNPNNIDAELTTVPVANRDNLQDAITYYRRIREALDSPQIRIFDNQVSI